MIYVFDTNIFIYYLTDERTVDFCFSEEFLSLNKILISPIIRIELLSFPNLSIEEDLAIKDLLSNFTSIPLIREIEDLTIELKRTHKIKLPDAIIAATSLYQNVILVTRNIHNFQGIAGLKLENPFKI